MWKRRDVEMWKRGDVETWRRGNVEMWILKSYFSHSERTALQADKTRANGEKQTFMFPKKVYAESIHRRRDYHIIQVLQLRSIHYQDSIPSAW
jgi:hypothetical protein